MTVVDDDELRERQASSLSEVLTDEHGVQTQSTNRGAGALILRGLVGPENLIVVDGVRFNQSTFRTGPNQYLDTIDPWALEQVEVMRGPGGVLYGTGAMGGVMLATPLSAPGQTEARSRFGFHSADDTAGASLDAGSRSGIFSGAAGVTLRRHGRLRVGSNGVGPGFVSGVKGDEFLGAPYDELHLRAATSVDLGPHRLRANYLGGLIHNAMRLDRLGRGEVRVYDNEDHLAYVTGEFDGPDAIDDFRLNLSWHHTGEVVDRFSCAAPGGRVRALYSCAALDRDVLQAQRQNVDVVDTFGSSFTGVSRLMDKGLTTTWGGDLYTDSVSSARADASSPEFEFVARDRGNFADGSRYFSAGAFGLVDYDVWAGGGNVFRAHAGARVEGFAASAPNVTDALGDVKYEFVGAVGTAGVAWVSGTTLNAYLNWNQGFRAPNLQETTVLGDTGNFYEVPNPELGPERSDTFEIGAKIDWADAIRIQPALWTSLLSNRITREATSFEGQAEIDGRGVRHRVNRDTAYFYGADLGLQTHRFKGASIFGNVSWIDGAVEADNDDPDLVEGPLHGLFAGGRKYENPRRLPPLTMTLGLRQQGKKWYVSTYLAAAAAQEKLGPDDLGDLRICEVDRGVLAADLGEVCAGTAGWITLNARAGFRFENVLIDVATLNLTDERYRRHGSGVPAPGLDLAAQLTMEY